MILVHPCKVPRHFPVPSRSVRTGLFHRTVGVVIFASRHRPSLRSSRRRIRWRTCTSAVAAFLCEEKKWHGRKLRAPTRCRAAIKVKSSPRWPLASWRTIAAELQRALATQHKDYSMSLSREANARHRRLGFYWLPSLRAAFSRRPRSSLRRQLLHGSTAEHRASSG